MFMRRDPALLQIVSRIVVTKYGTMSLVKSIVIACFESQIECYILVSSKWLTSDL